MHRTNIARLHGDLLSFTSRLYLVSAAAIDGLKYASSFHLVHTAKTALFRRSTLRRSLPVVLAVCLLVLVYIVFSDDKTIFNTLGPRKRHGPTAEQIASGENILPDQRMLKPDLAKLHPGITFIEPKINSSSPYPIGKTKPPDSDYTRTLVIASTKEENTTWIDPELGDMMKAGVLKKAVYVVDDKHAALRPPKNKGHEAMVYLTYIIDHYDDLSDISIFMHAHQYTWHNNEIMDSDAALMVRYLSPERVTRLGYMNLRCHWDPGCPDWLHPGEVTEDDEKQEQHIIASQWAELFPGQPVPTVLAQACCAQFAVSRERILALPKERYVELRKWLLRTRLDDYISGRIFEYTWQYIFAKTAIDCPSMSACYCDGYGLCFGDAKTFDYWFELRYWLGKMKKELIVWWDKADVVEQFRKHSRDGRIQDIHESLIPEPGLDEILQNNITKTWSKMKEMRKAAFDLGRDPAQRAFEAGRPWNKGDGY